MKKYIALLMLSLSSFVFADPAVFNLQLGKTSETQLKEQFKAKHSGINKYTSGNMYSIPVSQIQFDGLKEVTTIFNQEGILIGVLTIFPKSKFDYLNNAISQKYTLTSKNIPFVGNKTATYRDGSTEIKLDAPHLSFEMSMNYLHDDLTRTFNQINEAERRKKEQAESSLL
ncbi:hypothetical protein [Marinobacter sp. S6332]|uniref:hypothetical protein n=1 Tax=Marinobacter sp. S6332 TaxID=2926403 RepID=UPI001FF613D3|nr:hypothetical protein [Marinobacter sp. S6332]MCK0165896.1 hypothetical protein [Marinobacter sp. S6332]